MRAINTLRSWGVRIDETFFLGGIDKAEVLRIFRPHIFFDDQMAHLEGARRVAPSAQVPRRVTQLEAFGDVASIEARIAPLVVLPPARTPTPATRPVSPRPAPTGPASSRDKTEPRAPALDLADAVSKR
jgi:5'-nucleotidase